MLSRVSLLQGNRHKSWPADEDVLDVWVIKNFSRFNCLKRHRPYFLTAIILCKAEFLSETVSSKTLSEVTDSHTTKTPLALKMFIIYIIEAIKQTWLLLDRIAVDTSDWILNTNDSSGIVSDRKIRDVQTFRYYRTVITKPVMHMKSALFKRSLLNSW